MLVDEPFVGLDQGGKGALLELFDEVHDDGAALVVATHEPEFVERVERCIALRDGEVVFDGRAERRRRHEAGDRVVPGVVPYRPAAVGTWAITHTARRRKGYGRAVTHGTGRRPLGAHMRVRLKAMSWWSPS